MSQFYASIQGSRGKVTRQGGKESGIEGHIRGWKLGVRVIGFHEKGKDSFKIFKTSGSTGGGIENLIATITED